MVEADLGVVDHGLREAIRPELALDGLEGHDAPAVDDDLDGRLEDQDARLGASGHDLDDGRWRHERRRARHGRVELLDGDQQQRRRLGRCARARRA